MREIPQCHKRVTDFQFICYPERRVVLSFLHVDTLAPMGIPFRSHSIYGQCQFKRVNPKYSTIHSRPVIQFKHIVQHYLSYRERVLPMKYPHCAVCRCRPCIVATFSLRTDHPTVICICSCREEQCRQENHKASYIHILSV